MLRPSGAILLLIGQVVPRQFDQLSLDLIGQPVHVPMRTASPGSVGRAWENDF
jgi:hypothetical protein